MSAQIGLNVCLGTVKLSLVDFSRIQRGELFKVSWSPDQHAVVFLGEERIAEARLVSNGEELYAEITKLFD